MYLISTNTILLSIFNFLFQISCSRFIDFHKKLLNSVFELIISYIMAIRRYPLKNRGNW